MGQSLIRGLGKSSWLSSAGLALLFLFSFQASAVVIVLSDFDNTFVETRERYNGAWVTPFKLFRITHRFDPVWSSTQGPAEILVSPSEYERVRHDLARGERRPGNPAIEITTLDGQRVSAAIYQTVAPQTFWHFYPSGTFGEPIGEQAPSYLLSDFEAALERTKADPKLDWRGPTFPLVKMMLENEKTARGLGIITARAHTKEEWRMLFERLKGLGEIRNLPNFELFRSVGADEHVDLDHHAVDHVSITERKTRAVERIARILEKAQLTVTDERLAARGRQPVRSHFLIFADDDFNHVRSVTRLFQSFAGSGRFPVKFGVYFTGDEEDARKLRAESGQPRFAILTPTGSFREATFVERLGEPEGLSEESAEEIWNTGISCERYFKKRF